MRFSFLGETKQPVILPTPAAAVSTARKTPALAHYRATSYTTLLAAPAAPATTFASPQFIHTYHHRSTKLEAKKLPEADIHQQLLHPSREMARRAFFVPVSGTLSVLLGLMPVAHEAAATSPKVLISCVTCGAASVLAYSAPSPKSTPNFSPTCTIREREASSHLALQQRPFFTWRNTAAVVSSVCRWVNFAYYCLRLPH